VGFVNSGSRARWPWLKRLAASFLLLTVAACSSLGASGPSASSVRSASKHSVGAANIQIIRVTDAVARQVAAASRPALFSEALGDLPSAGTVIGRGDVLQVSIWEAPPAVLFGTSATFGASSVGSALGAPFQNQFDGFY